MVATSATAWSVWRSRISMRPLRAGDRERRGGRRVQQAGASLCLPALLVRHPQRFPLGGLPAVWWSLEPRSQFLSIDTHGKFETVQSGAPQRQLRTGGRLGLAKPFLTVPARLEVGRYFMERESVI